MSHLKRLRQQATLIAEEIKALEEAAEADAGRACTVDLLRTLLQTLPSPLYHRIRRTTLELRLHDAHVALLAGAGIPGDGVLLLRRDQTRPRVSAAVRLTPSGGKFELASRRQPCSNPECGPWWNTIVPYYVTGESKPGPMVAKQMAKYAMILTLVDNTGVCRLLLLERQGGVIRAETFHRHAQHDPELRALEDAMHGAVHRLMSV